MNLQEETMRIKSEIADIGCKLSFGLTCKEVVNKIVKDAIEKEKYSFLNITKIIYNERII